MAVKIRLKRMGQKKAPFDPNQEPSAFKVDEEAAKKWLNNGAQPTEVVGKIFKAAGIEK